MTRPYEDLADKQLQDKLYAAMMAERRICDAMARLDAESVELKPGDESPKAAKTR